MPAPSQRTRSSTVCARCATCSGSTATAPAVPAAVSCKKSPRDSASCTSIEDLLPGQPAVRTSLCAPSCNILSRELFIGGARPSRLTKFAEFDTTERVDLRAHDRLHHPLELLGWEDARTVVAGHIPDVQRPAEHAVVKAFERELGAVGSKTRREPGDRRTRRFERIAVACGLPLHLRCLGGAHDVSAEYVD